MRIYVVGRKWKKVSSSNSTSDLQVSQYVKNLNATAKSRYFSKLTYKKGLCTLPDPYELKGWKNDPSLWPELTFGDIYTYLIDTPGIYTRESLKAYKSLQGYQFFISGHVKVLWYHPVGDDIQFCFVKGKVIPSQRIRDSPHDVWVCLNKKASSVYCAHCTCMAGLGEVCSHVAALLFKVEAGVRLGLTKTSCTSEACQWNRVFREQLNPRSVVEFKDLVKRNRKDDVKSVGFSAAPCLPDITILRELKEICPNAAFFSLIPKLDPEDTDTGSEDEDETNLPQPLTALYSEENASLSPEDVQKKTTEVIGNLKYTEEQRKALEQATRHQAISPLWFEHRKGRITASKAHRIVQRRSTTPPENLIKLLMGYEMYDLTKTKQVKWGVDNEEKARDTYVAIKKKSHENFDCRFSGFVIDSERPYLGASADGIATCKCCPPRVVEIKCPFKHKDVRPIDAARIDPDFCLDQSGKLKLNHSYYTQVQVEIHVNKVFLGDLCVYTNKEVHIVEDIEYDQNFMFSFLKKADDFFAQHLLPEILTRRLDDAVSENCAEEVTVTEAEQLFCICNQPEYGKMIACDNKTCDIVWFHYSCVNIRRKPRGKWFCSSCKEDD